MKVFASCSLDNTEKYIISVLTLQLQKRNHTLTSSFNNPYSEKGYAYKQILNCDIFLGIISYNGSGIADVVNDYNYAHERKIPSLLLIEENVNHQKLNNIRNNIIYFNRDNPHPSIDKVNELIQSNKNKEANTNVLPWVLGGAAIIALISLLSSDDS